VTSQHERPNATGFTVTVKLGSRGDGGGGGGSAGRKDFEAYLGKRNCPKPTRSDHHLSCTKGDNVGKMVATVDATTLHHGRTPIESSGAVYYLGVTPYVP
jgi:hypothetical protein